MHEEEQQQRQQQQQHQVEQVVEEEARRAARRQLAKWAKIMLQIVGLERVAEELMGRRSWASFQDAMVGQECRTSEPVCAPPNAMGDGERSGSSSPGGGLASFPPWYIKPPDSPESPLDQPLDLSAKPSSTATAAPVAPLRPTKIPSPNKHIFKAKPRLSAVSGRRTYTEEELQAALRDIQSGKLGTRRAAVIYGIPRSTLRNKVYKLSQERRETGGGGVEPAVKEYDDDDDDRDLSEEEREVEKALMRPLLSVEDVMRSTWDGRALPYLQQLLGGAGGVSSEIGAGAANLPALVHKMMSTPGEDGASPLLRNVAGAVLGVRPSCSREEGGVILRVPSFRPKDGTSSPHDSSSPPVKVVPPTAVSLRDVICKTINSKLSGPDLTPPPSVAGSTQAHDYRRDPIRNHNNNHVDDKKLVQPNINKNNSSSNQNNNNNNNNNSGGKGTRPKRGKYRNYDRDSLVEAVRAVQRGEMSVHRAGSYYGVPHSTLEYKVKERHLMRPRKREPKTQGQPETEKRKPLSMSSASPEERPRIQRFTPPLPSNGLKVPAGFDLPGYPPSLPFPFWSPPPFAVPPMADYTAAATRELFASQMVQRLHEESGAAGAAAAAALGKTAREIAESLYDGSGENGNFLDGIIRSSLESGLPGVGGKEAKELFEQYCRGAMAAANAANLSQGEKTPPPPVPPPAPPSSNDPSSSPTPLSSSPERPSSACDDAQC